MDTTKLPTTAEEFERNRLLADWLLLATDGRRKNPVDDTGFDSFALRMLNKLRYLSLALQQSEYVLQQAMVTRSMIECVADIMAVYNSEDREATAKQYEDSSYNSYTALHTKIKKIATTGVFSNKYQKRRIFNGNYQTWTDTRLIDRIIAIDRVHKAINDYDMLSHYVHIGGSGSTHLLDELVKGSVPIIANYQIVFAVMVFCDSSYFTKEEATDFARLVGGMILEVNDHGNFKTPPMFRFTKA